MGTGKTTVAKALAVELGMIYVSIDELIEEREGKAIKDIFSDEGEPYFRKVEKEVLEQVMRQSDQVVDTGGGVVLNSENIKTMKDNGIVVCLWSDPQVIYERTKKYDVRPLLNVDDPAGRIRELLDRRRPFYEQADLHVDTTDLDVRSITGRIKKIAYETGQTEE